MKCPSIALLVFLLTPIVFLEEAAPQSPPPFAVTAANVVLASNIGGGSSAYTVSGIPMTGGLVVTCAYAGPVTTAKLPVCGMGPIAQIPVTAGQTLTGTVPIVPYGTPVPANDSARATSSPSLALLLGGACLLGLGLRRTGRSRLSAAVLAAGATAIVLTAGACGGSSGNPFAMTPGTYAYTLTASNSSNAVTPLAQSVSTTLTVTVP